MRRVFIYCKPCEAVVERGHCLHQFPNSSGRSAAPLFTYFEGPNGQVSIPAKEGARMTKRLRSLGYQERTVQDSKQYSDFCKRMDNDARAKHDQVYGALQERFNAMQKQRREELRDHIKTQYGKDFLEAAIAASEEGYGRQYEAGSHLEGYEYDNRRGRD